MNHRIRWRQGLLTLVVLGLLAFALINVRLSFPKAVHPAPGDSTVAQVAQVNATNTPLPDASPTEEPTREVIVVTEPPPGAPLIIPPGKDVEVATPTPFPTFTPRPTPTRRLEPTATAIPLPTPSDSIAGIIRYAGRTDKAPDSNYTHFELVIDDLGVVKSREPIAIPSDLGFTPFRIFISPNHQYVVYMEAIEPGGRPYVHDKATGKTNALFENYSGGSFYGWHPDGHRFLFWIDDAGLFLIDAKNLDIVTLTYPQGPVQGATISPDGLTVAYIASDLPIINSLWLISTAGSDAKSQIDTGTAYLYPGAWSPDNTLLLYYGACDTATTTKGKVFSVGLCTFNIKTQESLPLKLPFSAFAPVWSPNGRYIAATGVTQGEQECDKSERLLSGMEEKCMFKARSIYVADTQAGNIIQLTSGISPVWSPDGSKIAFLSNQTGNAEVWIIDLDGKGLSQLTTDGNFKSANSLTWSSEVN
jgi:WD40-like Beta Propeller Repeat